MNNELQTMFFGFEFAKGKERIKRHKKNTNRFSSQKGTWRIGRVKKRNDEKKVKMEKRRKWRKRRWKKRGAMKEMIKRRFLFVWTTNS